MLHDRPRNSLDLLSAFIDRPNLLKSGVLASEENTKNTLSLAEDRYVGMCVTKSLACCLDCLQSSNDCFVDKSVVKVIFWLVDQQWALALSQQDSSIVVHRCPVERCIDSFESVSIEKLNARLIAKRGRSQSCSACLRSAMCSISAWSGPIEP